MKDRSRARTSDEDMKRLFDHPRLDICLIELDDSAQTALMNNDILWMVVSRANRIGVGRSSSERSLDDGVKKKVCLGRYLQRVEISKCR